MTRRHALSILAVVAVLACGATQPARNFVYPFARKADVLDDYHGTKVADPYRWLEDADSEETLAWVEAENELALGFIRTKGWERIRDRLTELWNFPRYTLPVKEGGRYFFEKNDGLQDQSVLYVQDSLGAAPVALLDPNVLSQDGTVALTGWEPSRDGRHLAYLVSMGGSDWQELRVREVDTGSDLGEVLEHCKFTSIAWMPDGSGFYYNRFPDPATVPEEDRNNFSKVYFHRLGTEQSLDELVYERPEDKTLGFSPWITEDGHYLVLWVYRGTDPKNRIYIRKLGSEGDFVKLLDEADAMYVPLGNAGTRFVFHTDLDAPRGRIISIDLASPARESWKEVVAEQDEVIDVAAIVGDRLVLAYMKDAHDTLVTRALDGSDPRGIELPGIGSVAGLSGRQGDPELFFGYTSFLFPTSSFRHDLGAGTTEVFQMPEIDFDRERYETKQVFYESKDGTTVPMFITSRKGLELTGDVPTLLYGYGGFNISITPSFSISRLVWLEDGGVYAVANIRGGNEYGEQWHQAGILGSKQNVFDDFIAAAEWLIEAGYTSSERLGIMGGSNGGLLTAACMVQRPELFGAVVSAVPVIDMLRYHKFSVGRYWVSDYGNAEEDPEQFEFLYAYSPLHNIEEGTTYPPTLVTTADTDDRVVPMHGKKFVAALQAADSGKNPILLRVETKAGHGKGKPTSKKIEEAADIYAFLEKVLFQ
jgi:prolyl oligopeptidase